MKKGKQKTCWGKYSGQAQQVHLDHPLSQCVVTHLGEGLKDFFSKSQGGKTTQISDELSLLGKKLDLKTYGHKLSSLLRQAKGGPFKNKEWLYDHHWYTEAGDYLPSGLNLVVESELSLGRGEGPKKVIYGLIKSDFQKLLVSNADLRVMIFEIKKDSHIHSLAKYFDEAIEAYRNLLKGSQFLFIAFDRRISKPKGGFHYAEKIKGLNKVPLTLCS